MNIPARKIDAASIWRATDEAKFRVESMRRRLVDFDSDARKPERLRSCECGYCFYINASRLGGAAMTKTECGICHKEMMFCNTCVDLVCKECSRKHQICVHCGGDIEMKHRKKKREI